MHIMLLPPAIITLLFTSPYVTATPTITTSSRHHQHQPTSPNNLFRQIAAFTPRKQGPPICCLKPPPHEDDEDSDPLLSFEEWKAKQGQKELEEARLAKEIASSSSSVSISSSKSASAAASTDTNVDSPSNSSSNPDSQVNVEGAGSDGGVPDPNGETRASEQPLPPHFRVPLTDRFNYASLDCSARVHLTQKSAKSASAILSSKKDRYMLSPCGGKEKKEKNFVVVELCEDIRIDTVQLANFEFFSGVFKDFTVSVSKTYTNEDDGWTVAGTYRAKNMRGVQSFHTPESLSDFYRFIRIDFLSHYGNEFYCPLSLLRVYGLTHLEKWKWDMWADEYNAKKGLKDAEAASVPEHGNIAIESDSQESTMKEPVGSTTTAVLSSNGEEAAPSVTAHIPGPSSVDSNLKENAQESRGDGSIVTNHASITTAPSSHSSSIQGNASNVPGVSPTPSSAISSATRLLPEHISLPPPASKIGSLSTTTTTITAIPTASSHGHAMPPSSISVSSTGESIYRTIMNRLTALQVNHTLYARYAGEQHLRVRDALRRVGEDIGRLEGVGRAQAQVHQRASIEWEKQRDRLDKEFGMLMSRVDHLADQIVLERRLGIAQLCLLLAVLIFMGLTRGSRSETVLRSGESQRRNIREWGRRHLSLSGITRWNSRGRSLGAQVEKSSPSDPNSKQSQDLGVESKENKVPDRQFEFPKSPQPEQSQPTLAVKNRPAKLNLSLVRSRTPSNGRRAAAIAAGTVHLQRRPSTPTRPVSLHLQFTPPAGIKGSAAAHYFQHRHQFSPPIIAQSASWSSHGSPKSAKKWARSAHLHHVNVVKKHHDENDNGESSNGGGSKNSDKTGEDHSTIRIRGKNQEERLAELVIMDAAGSDGWVDTDDDELASGDVF